MKHLKKFNEELQPSTYVSAGKKLIDKGQEGRGRNLIDYGMSKSGANDEFTFYSQGLKIDTKWNFENKCFEGDERKVIKHKSSGVERTTFYVKLLDNRTPGTGIKNGKKNHRWYILC